MSDVRGRGEGLTKFRQCWTNGEVGLKIDVFVGCLLWMYLYWVKNSAVRNFADDKTISDAELSIEKLLETLERESQIATSGFKGNNCKPW